MVTNIQKCNTAGNIAQNVNFAGNYQTIVGATIEQNPSYFCQCVFGSSNVVDVSNKLSSDINQQADASSSMGSFITLIIIAALIVLGMIVVGYFIKLMNDQKNKAGGKDLPNLLTVLGIQNTKKPLATPAKKDEEDVLSSPIK
jgi:hypothetical protein